MLATSYPSQVFGGVHFALFGFNPITESKVRFKLVNGGAVDVGQYNGNCTHVIVDQIAYDDPVCVAARNDGKTVVTSLWVDHSADIGMPVAATSVMYRPLKDLNGIPGAQNLIVCLTGYLRQDRDDIMTMVDLMGAQFSKPLVANKVTHLICYKFEGEKYELAKRLGTIKLVNHCWLEDCLKEWALLPEDNYNKSGYDLEIMTEAKDSEEEAEDSELGQSGGRNISKSPLSSKLNIGTSHGSSKLAREVSNEFPDSTGPKGLPKVNEEKESSIIQGNKNIFDRDLSFGYVDHQKVSSEAPDASMDATSCQLPDTHVKISESKNADFPTEPSCQDLGIPENKNSNILVSDLHARNSESKKLVSDSRSAIASAEGVAHSDAKVIATGYSRKKQRGFTLPRNLNECLRNETGSSVSPLADSKFGNNLETTSSKVENASDGTKSVEPISILPQKRINEAASKKLKSKKMTADVKLSIKSAPSANGKSQGLKMASLVDEPPKAEGYLPVGKDDSNDPTTSSISKSAAPTSIPMAFDDEPFSRTANSKYVQCDNADQNSAEKAVQSLPDPKINGKPDIHGNGMGQVNGIESEQHEVTKTFECSSPGGNKKSPNEESTGPSNLDMSREESYKLIRKSPRKKPIAKRSLGSKSKSGATAKQKTSASLNKTILQGEAVSFSGGINDIATCDANMLQASPRIPDVNKSKEQETVSKYAEDAGGRPESLDDDTEAPDDKYELELGVVLDESKSELVHVSNKAEEKTEEKSETIRHMEKCGEATLPKEDANGTEIQKAPSLVGSTSKFEVKQHQARKRPAGGTKKTNAKKKLLKSKEAVSEDDKVPKERKQEAEMEALEETFPAADINDNSSAPRKVSDDLIEEDKENRPIDGVQEIVEGQTVKSRKPEKIKSEKMGLNPTMSEANRKLKTEPQCFIVSGHRLQRKEFQQAIKRLKGRVCRDSHQWSYQATHFIAPEPLRRTEKFFAAAASGRWILKTDFLTASIQAGKLIQEEPYEWHGYGLSEDGAINMEAPRKWRLLKERTGHGAFYGMRIIVYGDCITPPLDTLKRVVKAGDGTILATCPPYTRFLGSGIDYAIVSPGMPRVDLWVQEFLKHEIPCVTADYLVEYVCKPGSSLEGHVLYGTHAWAESSYAKLERRPEEVVEEEPATPEDCDSNDTICQVCGSRDRGDVMLICGDLGGSVGCGVGTHIDCCDPPLLDVPEDDWFCPKCSGKRKKGASSLSKRK